MLSLGSTILRFPTCPIGIPQTLNQTLKPTTTKKLAWKLCCDCGHLFPRPSKPTFPNIQLYNLNQGCVQVVAPVPEPHPPNP